MSEAYFFSSAGGRGVWGEFIFGGMFREEMSGGARVEIGAIYLVRFVFEPHRVRLCLHNC